MINVRIAVITWFHYRNYGTALQVYALCSYLMSEGHDVEIIRYYPRSMGRVLPDYSFRTTVKNVMGHRIAKIMSRNHEMQNSNSRVVYDRIFCDGEKEKRFEEFLNSALSFSQVCTTLSDLESLNDRYDAFICGSDQIWAPSIFDPHYFLDFVADTNKTISYAPSIGLPKVEDKLVYKHMAELIERIKYLSIREEKGAQIIKAMTGRKAEVVTDPTLLVSPEQWANICDEVDTDSDSYMIVYMLGCEETHWQEVYQIAEEKNLSVRVIPVFERDLERQGCITYPVGPLEFLSLFKNASYVCTDSFHGTIFSILFHRQFSVFGRFSDEDKINQNSRIYNILDATETRDRLIPYGKPYTETTDTDFERVDSLCNRWIKRSKQFLSDSLDGVMLGHRREIMSHVLSDHSLCCGCGACSFTCPRNAITIEMNSAGFYQAIVDNDQCINCGKCKTVCQFETCLPGVEMKDGDYYSYKDLDESVLQSSSSGGAAYRLATLLMDAGYAIAGCTYDVKIQKARHILIEKKEDLHRLQGSKYMQSSFSQIVPLIAASDLPVAIFGTPCQIAAARMLFADRQDFVYIDLICHGVPTYNLFKKYKKYLAENYGSKPENLNICYRYKPKRWRVRHTFTSDGKVETCFSQKEDLYFRMFESMNCYSPACYDCKWRDRTAADLRIGDFWGPLFEKDNTGVSIVGCFTEKGAKLLSELQGNSKGKLELQSSENYLKYQQTKNGVKPLFYAELMERLSDNKTKLPFIVEKYAEPFERGAVVRSTKERRMHILRLMLDE